MTTKQYAVFLQQNPNMTQEYAMDVLKKTRPQLKRIERVAGVKLKKCTLYNADKINDLDIVIVWCALNTTKPTLKKVIYFIRQQLGIELSHYKLKQKLAKFGLLIENIKDQQQHYINKFESEYFVMNRTWTDDEEQYLIANYANTSNIELAKTLGKKDANAIGAKASHLKLRKSGQFLRESCKARTKGQFKKGLIPHNKGKKLSQETKEKLKPTMFKRGNRPHNAQPVGTETKDKDGYVWVKIAEPSAWKLKHHIAYGEPVPTSHKLIFIDGNKYNFERENLKLISDADLMRLNTMHRFPPDLVRVIKTINKLQRKIKNGAESCAI